MSPESVPRNLLNQTSPRVCLIKHLQGVQEMPATTLSAPLPGARLSHPREDMLKFEYGRLPVFPASPGRRPCPFCPGSLMWSSLSRQASIPCLCRGPARTAGTLPAWGGEKPESKERSCQVSATSSPSAGSSPQSRRGTLGTRGASTWASFLSFGSVTCPTAYRARGF